MTMTTLALMIMATDGRKYVKKMDKIGTLSIHAQMLQKIMCKWEKRLNSKDSIADLFDLLNYSVF